MAPLHAETVEASNIYKLCRLSWLQTAIQLTADNPNRPGNADQAFALVQQARLPPATLPMLTMRPHFCFCMAGTSRLVSCIGASTLTCIVLCQSS